MKIFNRMGAGADLPSCQHAVKSGRPNCSLLLNVVGIIEQTSYLDLNFKLDKIIHMEKKDNQGTFLVKVSIRCQVFSRVCETSLFVTKHIKWK